VALRDCRVPRLERPAIAFHWDTDGVAAAAVVARRVGGGEPRVIKIGSYSRDAIPRPAAGELVVVDYGIPGPEYDALAREAPLALVVDHHKVEPANIPQYCNPVARGASEAAYPSAAIVAYRLLGGGPEEAVLAALGAAGDLAPYIDSGTPHPGLDLARRLAEPHGWSIARLRRLADAIDSAYRIHAPQCLEEAARAAASGGPKALEGLPCIWEARERAARIVEEALESLEGPEEAGCALFYRLVGDAHVTSAVGRRLAAENPDKVIVLFHESPSAGVVRLYARSITLPLRGLRDALEDLGVEAAGKESVVVAEAPIGEAPRLQAAARAAATRLCGTREARRGAPQT